MSEKTLIFDASVQGHHLEYLHHLYMGANSKSGREYVFVVSSKLKNIFGKLDWPERSNVIFEYIDENEIKILESKSGLIKAYHLCAILVRNIVKFSATNVILISLMEFMPFLAFIPRRSVRISGIIYLIYLYRWSKSSLWRKIEDVIKYKIFSNCSLFDNIYLLNDDFSPVYLNKKYKTSVFKYLPDPYVPLEGENVKNIRQKLDISANKIVYLQFGSITRRKGVIEILKAIENLNNDELEKLCFIFAGKIDHDVSCEFYTIIEKLEPRAQILVYDRFCDFDFIGSLCVSSDYLLIPYKNPEYSSGVLGYSAQFGIPVIAPSNGLLGKLVRKNNLGILLKDGTSENLNTLFKSMCAGKFKGNKFYLKSRTSEHFSDIILKLKN
jgi:glycosyltransferase involved in cell wall biosynthesis